MIALIEGALLVGIAMPLWSRMLEDVPRESEATVVRVVAEQFAWNIHYPGPDGVFGRTDPALVTTENPVGLDRSDPAARDDILSLNIMHLPVGRPVVLYLSSKDVIHSFSLPLYRIKQDAIPGQRVRVWFTPEKTSAELRRLMVSRYQVDPSDSSRDLSALSPLEDIRDDRGVVLYPASTPLTPDVLEALQVKGIREVEAAPDTPTEIACAQLCGLGHYRMRGFVTVESDSAYRSWLASQQPLLAPE
jgi:cytochrome c oxidase subunit 2